jgi:hypothetical protein
MRRDYGLQSMGTGYRVRAQATDYRLQVEATEDNGEALAVPEV